MSAWCPKKSACIGPELAPPRLPTSRMSIPNHSTWHQKGSPVVGIPIHIHTLRSRARPEAMPSPPPTTAFASTTLCAALPPRRHPCCSFMAGRARTSTSATPLTSLPSALAARSLQSTCGSMATATSPRGAFTSRGSRPTCVTCSLTSKRCTPRHSLLSWAHRSAVQSSGPTSSFLLTQRSEEWSLSIRHQASGAFQTGPSAQGHL